MLLLEGSEGSQASCSEGGKTRLIIASRISDSKVTPHALPIHCTHMSVCLKARMVERPMMDSEKCAYRGDRVTLDRRFNSRDVCR